MTYTITMDIFIDDDNIMGDNELEDAIEEMLNMVTIHNFKVLEVNDQENKLWQLLNVNSVNNHF